MSSRLMPKKPASSSETLSPTEPHAPRCLLCASSSPSYQPLLEAVPGLGEVAVLALGGYLAIRHEIFLSAPSWPFRPI